MQQYLQQEDLQQKEEHRQLEAEEAQQQLQRLPQEEEEEEADRVEQLLLQSAGQREQVAAGQELAELAPHSQEAAQKTSSDRAIFSQQQPRSGP